jgi:hypothetical protein
VQTRDPQHRAAQDLAKLPNVSFHVGHIESDDLLREAMEGMDGVFFLANGFAIGDKAEIFWSMRAFEIARETGVKYFQFSSIDYYLKKGGYDSKYRCAHADAKGRVGGTTALSASSHSVSNYNSNRLCHGWRRLDTASADQSDEVGHPHLECVTASSVLATHACDHD